MMDPRDLQMGGTRPCCKLKMLLLDKTRCFYEQLPESFFSVELSFLDTKHRNQRVSCPSEFWEIDLSCFFFGPRAFPENFLEATIGLQTSS